MDLVRERAHDVEVVAEQDDRDAARRDRRQLVDDEALGQGVLAGGGLVRDDDPGAEQEGLGEDDALLLATGELMRVAAQQRFSVGELGIGQGLEDAFAGGCSASAAGQVTYLRAGDVGQQGADTAGRVEDGRRMLRHVSDEALVRHADIAADVRAHRELAEQGQPGGRLPAARGTHQRGDPAGQDTQTHPVDDRPAAHLDP